ncbi:glycoside hydrolase family 32 protein [Deinococcus aquatilis]|uniref:glycoside hydrolase family 32 protein n=1 Tax=Deinococcus aquatilis TaxID=519440 RepID=UPI000376C1A3|nr:glycoside hydrolase family 32 protein [Deinococcus aquatilis]
MSQNIVDREQYRPHIHYTPAANWMNDPNGLVYFGGLYHLYYQYNPYSSSHANMHWGRATSTDLVHWQEREVALPEHKHQVFSGSAVVDWHNTSGFGQGRQPPLVACYTGHTADNQAQFLAYSLDQGVTWTYHDEPVLDLGKQDFRDPKIFWHAASAQWIMVVVHPVERQVELYGSGNLREWTSLSIFGPVGFTGGIWEVPDLFPLEDETGRTHWVMKVDLNPGGPYGGSGVQYWLGNFDGQNFTATTSARWLDHGNDFYAALTWNDLTGRRVWIAWMSNWRYAHDVPTLGWRGAMTLPREVCVCADPDLPTLAQRPVPELQALRQHWTDLQGGGRFSLTEHQAHEVLLQWPALPDGRVILEFHSASGCELSVEVVLEEVVVRRPATVSTTLLEGYSGEHRGKLPSHLTQHDLHIFLDASSVEVFAAAGRIVISDLLFPSEAIREMTVHVSGLEPASFQGELWSLNSSTP